MEKASRWIRNLLIGKREEKSVNKGSAPAAAAALPTSPVTTTLPPTSTTPLKKRWSFRRSGRTNHHADKATNHRSSRSFDSQLLSIEYKCITPALARYSGPVEDAAATKIQAFFRSYLARKALCALRGLVKIQALIRGHLVRKQTTAMVRCMNALMTIQVRARVQRIERTRNTGLTQEVCRLSTGAPDCEMEDVNVTKSRRRFAGQNQKIAYHSGRHSFSRSKHQSQLNSDASLLSVHSSSTSYDRQVREVSLSTPQRNFRQLTCQSKPVLLPTMLAKYAADTKSQVYALKPSYMARTESSKAKVRSQSEPKQRPMKQKSRRTASTEGITVPQDIQAHSPSSYAQKSINDPWSVKLYKLSKIAKDIECNSGSTSTSDSSYYPALFAYEPAATFTSDQSSAFNIRRK